MNLFLSDLKNWFHLRFRRAEIVSFISNWQREIESDRIVRGIPTDLNGYRTKFARNLVGNWTTNPGFGPFAVTKWQFFADGRAQELLFSGSGDEETRYLWREADDFAIELTEVASDGDEPAQWFVLNYAFKLDSERIVLFSLPENEHFKFHFCPDYLHFEGDHANET